MQSSKLFYPNSTLYADIQETSRTYFYENGTLKTIEPYRDGKLHGEAILYWPNGKMKRRSHFQQGIRQGLDQIWSEEGTLVDEGSYDLGKPVGLHRRWTLKGSLLEEIRYIDSLRFNFLQWDELGVLRCEGVWVDESYSEKTWDHFEMTWKQRQGRWDGKKVVYS